MKTYNYYCDESTHLENDGMPYMLLGYVSVPYPQIKLHKENIKAIKTKHKFYGEIKWSKVSHSKYEFYSDLIEYFFASDLCFRCIVIDKSCISKTETDHETFFYKMYYQLIYHKIDTFSSYNIYLDIKDTLSSNKVQILKGILQTKLGVIRNLQNIHSKESPFMQICDLLMGAINYNLRNMDSVKAKNQLINRIKRYSGSNLDKSSSIHESKLNLFFIDLKR